MCVSLHVLKFFTALSKNLCKAVLCNLNDWISLEASLFECKWFSDNWKLQLAGPCIKTEPHPVLMFYSGFREFLISVVLKMVKSWQIPQISVVSMTNSEWTFMFLGNIRTDHVLVQSSSSEVWSVGSSDTRWGLCSKGFCFVFIFHV